MINNQNYEINEDEAMAGSFYHEIVFSKDRLLEHQKYFNFEEVNEMVDAASRLYSRLLTLREEKRANKS